MCNFLEYKGTVFSSSDTLYLDQCLSLSIFANAVFISVSDTKIVYRRYASLFFIAGCDSTDNELITLEIVHRYVEQMDKYYGNVCELDIIFNFQKAYFILDELLLAGELQESSKKNVLRCISQEDSLEDMEVSAQTSCFSNALSRGHIDISTMACCLHVSLACDLVAAELPVACDFYRCIWMWLLMRWICVNSGRRRCHQDHVECDPAREDFLNRVPSRETHYHD
jgi:hypothetical protein